MKRTFRTPAAILPALLALAVAGCSKASDSPTTPADKPVTITYVTPAENAVLTKGEKPLITAFEQANPNITVKITQIPTANYNTKLITEFRGGQGPDILRVNHTDIQTFSNGGFLAPLDDTIGNDKIDTGALIPGLLEAGKVRGKQMTLPLTTDTRVLFYNPKLLKQHGISAPPATWADLLKDTKAFAGTKAYGYGFPTESDYSMSYDAIGPYMKGAGGELLNADGSKADAADSQGTLKAVQLVQDIVKTGAVPPGIGSTSGDTLAQLFSQNKLAFMLGGPWVRASLEEDNPKITYGKDYMTAPVPVETSGQPSGSTAGGWQIGISKSSQNVDAAGKLLSFLMQPDNLVKLNADEAFAPTTNGLSSEPWASDPFYQAYSTVLPNAGLPITPVARLVEVSAAFEAAVRPVIVSPDKPASAALQAFDTKTNAGILQ